MKTTMRSFRTLSLDEQRQRHTSSLRRALTVSKGRLEILYAFELKQADKLRNKARELTNRINKAEDAIANAADRKYGWRKWRHSKRLREKVTEQMFAAGNSFRQKQGEYHQKAQALVAPYNREMEELDELHEKLVNQTWE